MWKKVRASGKIINYGENLFNKKESIKCYWMMKDIQM